MGEERKRANIFPAGHRALGSFHYDAPMSPRHQRCRAVEIVGSLVKNNVDPSGASLGCSQLSKVPSGVIGMTLDMDTCTVAFNQQVLPLSAGLGLVSAESRK